MLFISYMICVCLIIWLAVLNDKVNTLSMKIDKIKNVVFKDGENPISEYYEQTSSESTPAPSVSPEIPAPESSEQKAELQANYDNYISDKNKPEDFDLQKALLGNIFNKIGAVAIIVALIIFIKLVSPYIVITPLMKVIFAYLAGIGLLGGGFYLHKKETLKNLFKESADLENEILKDLETLEFHEDVK